MSTAYNKPKKPSRPKKPNRPKKPRKQNSIAKNMLCSGLYSQKVVPSAKQYKRNAKHKNLTLN